MTLPGCQSIPVMRWLACDNLTIKTLRGRVNWSRELACKAGALVKVMFISEGNPHNLFIITVYLVQLHNVNNTIGRLICYYHLLPICCLSHHHLATMAAWTDLPFEIKWMILSLHLISALDDVRHDQWRDPAFSHQTFTNLIRACPELASEAQCQMRGTINKIEEYLVSRGNMKTDNKRNKLFDRYWGDRPGRKRVEFDSVIPLEVKFLEGCLKYVEQMERMDILQATWLYFRRGTHRGILSPWILEVHMSQQMLFFYELH